MMTAGLRHFHLLDSAGAMRAGYPAHDWSHSTVGDPDGWSLALRSAVNLILDSQFPMFVVWGPQLAFLYNATYIPLLEDKHPTALGAPLRQVWPELWPSVGPLVARALAGEPTFGEDVPRTIVRNGRAHKAWFTLSYSPLRDEDGTVRGALCVINETTGRVLLETRQALQLQLVDRLRDLDEPDDIVALASEMLGHYLDVSHVFYADVDDSARSFAIRCDWSRKRDQNLAGRSGRLDDFGPAMIAELRAGTALAIDDVRGDPRTGPHAQSFDRLGIQSLLVLPLARDGRLAGTLNVHDSGPRPWSPEDRKLASDIAERAWSAVERVRAERELRAASAHQSRLLSMNEFQLQVADSLRTLAAPADILIRTSELLGRFLNASRVLYGDYDSEEKLVTYHANYTDGSVSPLHGTYPCAGFGQHNFAALETGETWVSDDLATDPRTNRPDTWPAFAARQIGAAVVVPLNRNGAMLACLFVNQREPRHWARDEVRLICDVAERAWSAVERVRAEEALRQADRRKDEFLAMLAHELRNPLAPISAAAQLLNMGPLDPARLARTSSIIGRQVAHMTGLIDDLLDVSRVTRGLVLLARAEVDVARVVADAVEQVRPLIEARRHQLTVHTPPGSVLVEGDYKRLVQVLANLLNNAAKYTPEGGKLLVWMGTSADQVVMSVSDSGIGIPAELLPTVFDLFSQAERTPDRAQGGLGLGLALVKSLVELHGGTVAVTSEARNAGSEFTVRLPRLLRAAGVAALPDAAPAAVPYGAPLRVLLVDDNVDAAQTLCMLLESAGHAVTVAHSPAAALLTARVTAFDAYLLDIGLPGLDGYQLARRLRAMAHSRDALMIAITGYGQQFDRESALQAQFDHYFVKPADPAELFGLLAKGAARHAH
jgi:signal transduction histidine kinase/ActR/RegA family two-component response regulator